MNKIYRLSLIITLLLSTHLSFSQVERTFSGTLTDDTGLPLVGATVLIKGTTTGTVADLDGYYEINVAIGDIVVISFIGMTSAEVVITYENSEPRRTSRGRSTSYAPTDRPIKKTPPPVGSLLQTHKHKLSDFLVDSTKAPIGSQNIIRMPNNAPQFKVKAYAEKNKRGGFLYKQVDGAHDIIYLPPAKAKEETGEYTRAYVIILPKWESRWKAYRSKALSDTQKRTFITLQTSFTAENAFLLPELQSTYAQGRPINGALTWQGADKNEVFSWGPLVSSLSYDGTSYAYDPQGALIAGNSGTGANTFNAQNIFRKGIKATQSLSAHYLLDNYHKVGLRFSDERSNGILWNQSTASQSITLESEHHLFKARLLIRPSFQYVTKETTLPLAGGNWTNIIQSAYVTPSTFDNTNRTNHKTAYNTINAYQLADGTNRSFAPTLFDNPFGLLGSLPDESQNTYKNAKLFWDYVLASKFTLNGHFNYQSSSNKLVVGLRPNMATFSAGRLTERTEETQNLAAMLRIAHSSMQVDRYYVDLIPSFTYQFRAHERDLTRFDGTTFTTSEAYTLQNASQLSAIKNHNKRLTHEGILNLMFNHYSGIELSLNNIFYLSSTLEQPELFQPHVKLQVDLREIILDSYRPFDALYVFFHAGRHIREADLGYNSWHFNSTNQNIQNARNFFGSEELWFEKQLNPVINTEYEAGISARLFNDLFLSVNVFHQTTENFILPVQSGSSFKLQNTGTIQNRGIEAQADFYHYFGGSSYKNDFQSSYTLTFSKNKPVVTHLNNGQTQIPIAGFESISSNMMLDQPYGVLIGKVYQRTATGDLVIGTDGFPLVASELAVVGNPNPDFKLTFQHEIAWKAFAFSTLWEWQKGGDIWNGTAQTLDYYGRSAYTATARNIEQYIFDGVLQNGTRNNILVDFANPANSVNENRWVRYGVDGPVEDYIQSGSFFRLQEVRLEYKPDHFIGKSTLIVSLFAHNLLTYTPYQGSVPQTHLFGTSEGAGLDYFNAPNTRRYGISAKLTF